MVSIRKSLRNNLILTWKSEDSSSLEDAFRIPFCCREALRPGEYGWNPWPSLQRYNEASEFPGWGGMAGTAWTNDPHEETLQTAQS